MKYTLLLYSAIILSGTLSATSSAEVLTPGVYLSDGFMCDVEVSAHSTGDVLITRALPSAGGVPGAKKCSLRPFKQWYRIGNSSVFNFEETISFPASMRILSSVQFVHNSPLGSHIYHFRGH